MIHIIITSYNEPKSTEKAINSILEQNLDKKIKEKFKIIVCDPFPEVKDFIEKKFKNKNIEFFLDPGEGKSTALNMLFNNIYSKNKDDLIVLTDGDVFIDKEAINEILNIFKDKKTGVICGHPYPINERNNKYGFWAHFQFYAISEIRKKLSKRGFFETSGYLFAIRNSVIKEFPTDSSEDSIIPFLFWKKGYKIAYADKALVYVLNPQNFKDWVQQRKRNIKGHATIKKNVSEKLEDSPPRTKSLFNEIKRGTLLSFTYPKNIKEMFWMLQFYFARFYAWMIAYYEIKFKKQKYKDGWREVEIESTKPLD